MNGKPINDSMNSVLTSYRQSAEAEEKQNLFLKAAFSKDHNPFYPVEPDHRLPYKRDVDRIIYSKAYSRYIDKTQVVYLIENDHMTHRNLHVQLVSSFARGIAKILHLNQDLVEAISLGHDVGHPPFGHEGEEYLSKLSQESGNGIFAHSWQSCRLLFEIEPLNLGLAVYDGFLCHDGGMGTATLVPRNGKTWNDHIAELKEKLSDPDKPPIPGTVEGCLVKLCDTISYIGRDIEDAINLGIITRDRIPRTILGQTNRSILQVVGCDIINNSYEKECIAISEEVHSALLTLRLFNFENIYTNPQLKVESKKVERAYQILFNYLLDDLEKHETASYIWENYLNDKPEKYVSSTAPSRHVIDYIAGMTDNFFVRTLETLILPKPIEIH
ncbi:MAG: HD domain-containing protein [Waddliaceae bacterium]